MGDVFYEGVYLPTEGMTPEEQNECVLKQIKVWNLINQICNKNKDNPDFNTDINFWMSKTIEQLEEELNLLNNK